jgi:hypothetical protein
MGLDWKPPAKPKSGHEAEFETLWRQLNEAAGILRPTAAQGFWSGLFRSTPKFDQDAAIARFQEITVPPYENLGAPVVGHDAEADAWVLSRHANGSLNLPEGSTTAQTLADFQGFHVLDLLPECDGFPVYTHADMYDGVDQTSFRGKFLESCTQVIGKDLLKRAWEPILARDLADYGGALRACADQFAIKSGNSKVIGNWAFEWKDEGDLASQLHVVDQAARWCLFWSMRGHGLEPYF